MVNLLENSTIVVGVKVGEMSGLKAYCFHSVNANYWGRKGRMVNLLEYSTIVVGEMSSLNSQLLPLCQKSAILEGVAILPIHHYDALRKIYVSTLKITGLNPVSRRLTAHNF